MKFPRVRALILLLISVSLSACSAYRETPQDAAHKVTVTTPQSKAVTLTRQYHGRINSHHHIEIRAPEKGYLGAIAIRDGETVKRGDLLFQVRPLRDQEKLDTEKGGKTVSVRAPFDGMVGRLLHQQLSFVQKSDPLTTLSDNSLISVYFNVPETSYLEFKSANLDQHKDDLKIELVLANGEKFDHLGKFAMIGANFKDGNVACRADLPNPDGLLRHGQNGKVLISQVQNDAIVIPQRAALELLHKRYVYVVDKDDVAHHREIIIQNEFEDLFVIKTGVGVDDKIVLEGVRLIRDGDKVEYEDHQPKKASAGPK